MAEVTRPNSSDRTRSLNSLKFFVGHEGVFAYFQQLIRCNIHDDPYYWLRRDVPDEVIGVDNLPSSVANLDKLIVYGTSGFDQKLASLLNQNPALQQLSIFGLVRCLDPCYEAINRMERLTRLELFDSLLSSLNVDMLKQVLSQLDHFTLSNSRSSSSTSNASYDVIDSMLCALSPDRLTHLALNELRYPMSRLEHVLTVLNPGLANRVSHLTLNLLCTQPDQSKPADVRMTETELEKICMLFPSLTSLNVCLYTRVNYWDIVRPLARLGHLVELRIFSDYEEKDKDSYTYEAGHPPITERLTHIRRLSLSGRSDCTSTFVSILPRMFPQLETLHVLNEGSFLGLMRFRFLKNFTHLRKFSMYLNSDIGRFVVPRFAALYDARCSDALQDEFEFAPYGEVDMSGKRVKPPLGDEQYARESDDSERDSDTDKYEW